MPQRTQNTHVCADGLCMACYNTKIAADPSVPLPTARIHTQDDAELQQHAYGSTTHAPQSVRKYPS